MAEGLSEGVTRVWVGSLCVLWCTYTWLQVIDAMDYACYVLDVGHVVLDNLQFMLSGQGRGHEIWEMQNSAIEKFRRFATTKNVHISIVVHPRKEVSSFSLQAFFLFFLFPFFMSVLTCPEKRLRQHLDRRGWLKWTASYASRQVLSYSC